MGVYRLAYELDRETITVLVNELNHFLTLWVEFRCEKSRCSLEQFVSISEALDSPGAAWRPQQLGLRAGAGECNHHGEPAASIAWPCARRHPILVLLPGTLVALTDFLSLIHI